MGTTGGVAQRKQRRCMQFESEVEDFRDSSNRLLGGWLAYDTEAALPHSDPQLKTSRTVLDRWVCGGYHGGGTRGLIPARGMRRSNRSDRMKMS